MKLGKLFLVNLVLVLLLLTTSLALGCEAQPTTPQKTLKIGFLNDLGGSTGLEALHVLEVQADMDNERGGVEIGGEFYNVQIIAYDTGNSDQPTAVAAANRLIFEDEVKYIIFGAPALVSAWINTTEENKVLALGSSPDMSNELPTVHYGFNPTFKNGGDPAVTGWFCENYPDVVAQGVVSAYADNQLGRMFSQMIGGLWQAFGVEPTDVFFPEGAADLSSMATRVKTLNPGCFTTGGNGSTTDANIFKSVWSAGYEGMFFTSTSPSTDLYVNAAGEAVEGLICRMNATDPDPALTEAAQEFKNAWIDKYGEWTSPDITQTVTYCALIAALQEAGSLDTDAVADVLANGLEFDTLEGYAQMMSRPDLGNSRTVDCAGTIYLKQIRDGQATLIATIPPEEVIAYFRLVYPEPTQ
jgi:branched-chain amino acid transport system substrate-binding protein